jgi:serine/threonine protein kinase
MDVCCWVYFKKLNLNVLGERLGKGSFGIVRKAVHVSTNKEYAVKISGLETDVGKRTADAEKAALDRLNGFSPYLINMIECFDEVCYFLQENLFAVISV